MLIRKTFRPEVISFDEVTGVINMLIPMSTGAQDRAAEVIDPKAWANTLAKFMERPILVSSHDYTDLRKQIGEFTEFSLTDKGLLASPKYYVNQGNEEADWAFKLASKGMAAYSVGFIELLSEIVDGVKHYTECELMEISQVIVPCNPEAAQNMRGKADDVLKSVIDDIASAEIWDMTEETPKKLASQAELADELDYVLSCAKDVGLNDDNQKLLMELLRCTGSDIPEDISEVKMLVKDKKACKEALDECVKCKDALAAHHKAHNEVHKAHSESIDKAIGRLKEMVGDEPEPQDAEAKSIEALITNILDNKE